MRIQIYPSTGVHKTFADKLNVVTIHKHNQQTGKSARVILLSTDLDLKARHHGVRYARKALKVLPQTADVINFNDWMKKIPVLGNIHRQKMVA